MKFGCYLECDPNCYCRLLIQQKFDSSKTNTNTNTRINTMPKTSMHHWPNCCLILFWKGFLFFELPRFVWLPQAHKK